MLKSLIWIILLLFAVSCAPTAELPAETEGLEPTANLSNEKPELDIEEEALETAVSSTAEPTETVEPVIEIELEAALATPSNKLDQSANPIVVDLSQLTPPADNGGEQIIAPAPGIPDATSKIVTEVTKALSELLSIDSNEIAFKSIAEVQWRNSGLGCPQPGMSYLQVITDGYQIVLTANNQEYYFHTRGTDTFIYCQNPTLPSESASPSPSLDN